jgi:hypothetical protein
MIWRVEFAEVQQRVLDAYGIRVEPEMAKYLLRRLSAGGKVGVIGGDARTGMPTRKLIDPAALAASSPPSISDSLFPQ